MEEKGVTPEQRIGIYSHKGWEQIVAALAIQIVGCAYVAIDPNLPAIRQEFILNDSNISFIITSEELVKELERNTYTIVVCKADYLSKKRHNVISEYCWDHKKSCIFDIYIWVSGTPKGVVITHESAYNTNL